jgi:hypothetical protein
MSSDHDFEHELRHARGTLPDPEGDVTEDARSRALRAVRRRHPRARVTALAGVALGLALALGIGVGSFVVPSTTASQGPPGLGFLPQDDWYVLQAGTHATPERPAVAIASNVPLSPEDGNSIVPYSTLLELPPQGIVIVANFTGQVDEATRVARSVPNAIGWGYPDHDLPLRVRDALPYIQYGGQIRPEQPLGQYQLKATVKGFAVDLHIYFGTVQPSDAQFALAQEQLDQLIVRKSKRSVPTATIAPGSTAWPAAPVVIDRTLSCNTVTLGGIREVEARAHRGYRFGNEWQKLPYAVVSSGAEAGSSVGGRTIAPDNSLAWITAGSPSPATTADDEYLTFPVKNSGTLGLNTTICKPAKKRIPLTRASLRNAGAISLLEEYDCPSPKVVFVRVRAVVTSKATPRRRGFFKAISIPVQEAELAVRTAAGKPMVYAQVLQSGRTRLYTAPRCAPD